MVRMKLEETGLWLEDKQQAREIWDAGYRPTNVKDVKRGDYIVYWDADLMGDGVGQPRFSEAYSATEISEYEYEIEHGGGTVQCDEGDVVWMKRPGGLVDELMQAERLANG